MTPDHRRLLDGLARDVPAVLRFLLPSVVWQTEESGELESADEREEAVEWQSRVASAR
jgi:hypothetical protein